ncbi:WhiB family transcriptional regulator [Streptomyces sp. WAC07061]|uniref:WhiB family transcriptional regulator n=1 Tax=Streptomyces sp. WAC07061 TaxID=2487410 RepID=UPI000F783533|nr:WhiB family transcriptional regulator [Streptomyces sp. WAC07061]RSS57962.1 WhiB family transcriptional regulator [Streptomyces sp. WAC07061]
MSDISRTDELLPPRNTGPRNAGPFDGPCRTAARDVFTRRAHEQAAAAREREEAAKAVCRDCPVRVPCRRHALAGRVPHGVRGGLTPAERRSLLMDAGSG